MRIHRVLLRNYRGVTEAEVDFAADGVTIVEGDNEVGKTSLSEAIDMILSDRDDSTKKAVKSVKPVDRDVGAEVEIDISTGPYRLRYRKRWHRQKETVLELLEPERSQLTGREAHDRVRQILDETLDAGLWDALRLRQGRQLEQADFAGGSLGRALDLAAGGDSTGEREDDLWARIGAERDRYWTATGQARVERNAAASRAQEAETEVAVLRSALADLQHDAEQVERLTVEAAALADKQRENHARVAELQGRFDAVRAQRGEVERLTGSRDAARAEHDRAREVAKARRDLLARVTAESATVEELRSVVAAALPTRTRLESRLRDARQALDAARGRLREAEAVHRRAVNDRDYRRQQIELAQLSERLGRITDATRRRSEAAGRLDALRVDAELFARIDAAHLDVVRADAAATGGAATVDATAVADVTLKVDGRSVDLRAGEQHRIPVPSSARVEVPGTVSMMITAGAGAQALADRLVEARQVLAGLCAEGGVPDAAAAREALTRRDEAERTMAETAATIEQDLRDLTSEDLAQKVDRLRARVSDHEAERPTDPPVPVDLDAAQAIESECDGAVSRCRADMDRLEAEAAAATAEVQSVDIGDATSKARLEQAQLALDNSHQALAAARREVPDADVDRRLVRAESDLADCDAALAHAEDRLAAGDPDSVEALLVNAKEVTDRLAGELHDVEIRTRELKMKLALKGDEGLAHHLDIATSELHRLRVDHERLEARAAAAKRLHDTFAARRAEAHHRYVAPFRDRIEQLGRLVFDGGFEVDLDDDLRIARRTLGGVTLDFDDLSTGAQEQLGIIARLACASIVSADGGAPVIFDDALGWSDPNRLDRMGAVIASAGRTCQIIVLTCTPGRYEAVGNATVVRLPM